MVRGSLLAMWTGSEAFEGEGIGRTNQGEAVRVTLTLGLPRTPEEAHRAPVYLMDRTEAANRDDRTLARESRFRAAFDHAAHGMALVDADGLILHANPAFCDLFGLDQAALRALRVEDLTTNASRDDERARREALAPGAGPTRYALEKPIHHASGAERWVHATGTLIDHGMDGGGDGHLLYQVRDITDQVRADMRAKQAESQLRGTLETITDDVLLFDPDDRLVLANSHFLNSEPDLADVLAPGTPFPVIVHRIAELGLVQPCDGQSVPDWSRWRLDHYKSADPEPFEVRTDHGRWMLVRQGRASDGSTLILRSDITAFKQREAALALAKGEADRANRAKTEFLGNMSHELRTPLNAIIGFSEVMLNQLHGPLGAEPYQDYVRSILSSGRHLLEIINDILDLSRLEAGDLRLAESETLLADLTKRCLRLSLPQARDKDQTLTCDLPPSIPLVRCDPERLRQVLHNLVSNAVKYTPRGGSIAIRARRGHSGDLILSVSDTGRGMSAAEIDVALSTFGQIDGVFTRGQGGTGLGLPLSRALVEAHGGALEVLSQPGRGTTVMVRLPAERVLDPTRRNAERIPAMASAPGPGTGS